METASFVIGVVALLVGVLAIPTILQMYFGRPRLTFEADDFTGPDARILLIKIQNEPVKSKLLLLLGIEREPGGLLAFVSVQKLGTNEILVRAAPGLLNCTPLRSLGLSARALPGFVVGLAVISTRKGTAHIVDARAGDTDDGIPIAPGAYMANIAIVRGQRTYNIKQTFTVGAEDHRTFWDSRKVEYIRS